MAPAFNVAVLIYPGADIIDFCGPLEVYSTDPPPLGAPPSKPRDFKTTTFSGQSQVKAAASQVLTIQPDRLLKDLKTELEEYDILVIPGANPDVIETYLATEDGKATTELIKAFSKLPPRHESGHRIIQTVCTGALLVAASGILMGKDVTTHHMTYDILKDIADDAAGGDSKINIVRKKRWVDGGKTDAGVRLVNAGGVTSGIDASLYIVEMLVGKEAADWICSIVEFERRGQDAGWSA